MKQIIITPDDFLEIMDKSSYYLFLKNLRKKAKIPSNEPIWIIAEFSEQEEMPYDEAEEIVRLYEKNLDVSCTCFQGHAPCGKCENMPSEEEYENALNRLERGY